MNDLKLPHQSDLASASPASPARTSRKTRFLQLTLLLALAVSLVLGIWIRVIGAGWYLLILGIPLVLIVILHIVFQIAAIRKVTMAIPSYVTLLLLSDLFFFFSFVLQFDGGDGGANLAILTFYEHYFGSSTARTVPFVNSAVSILFLLALFISWSLFSRRSFLLPEFRHKQLTEAETEIILEHLRYADQTDGMAQKLFFDETKIIRQQGINNERIIESLNRIASNNPSASTRQEAIKTLKYLGVTPIAAK